MMVSKCVDQYMADLYYTSNILASLLTGAKAAVLTYTDFCFVPAGPCLDMSPQRWGKQIL